MEVLEYAVKHGYAELADEAAYNAIGCEAADMANKFSLETFKGWVCLFFPVVFWLLLQPNLGFIFGAVAKCLDFCAQCSPHYQPPQPPQPLRPNPR